MNRGAWVGAGLFGVLAVGAAAVLFAPRSTEAPVSVVRPRPEPRIDPSPRPVPADVPSENPTRTAPSVGAPPSVAPDLRAPPAPPTRDFAAVDARLQELDAHADVLRTPAQWHRLAEELTAEFNALDDLDCTEKQPRIGTLIELALQAGLAAERSGTRDPELFKSSEIGEVNWAWWLAAGFIHDEGIAPPESPEALAEGVAPYLDALKAGRSAPMRLCADHFAIGEAPQD